MSNMPISKQQVFSPRTIWKNLLPPLIYAAILPYLIYIVARGQLHLSEVNALLLATISPIISVLVELIQKRRLSLIGSFALVGIAAKLLSALLFHDPRLVLMSDSLMTGIYGLLLLGSVLIGKPVLVALIKSSYRESSPEQRALIDQGLQSSGIHRRFQFLTTLWGMGLLLTLAISVLLTYTLPVEQVVLFRPVIDYGIIAILLATSIAYGYIVRTRKRQSDNN